MLIDASALAHCQDTDDRSALAWLAEQARMHDGAPFPVTNNDLARAWGMSPTGARKRFRRLVELRIITVVQQGGGRAYGRRMVQLSTPQPPSARNAIGTSYTYARPSGKPVRRKGHKIRAKSEVRIPPALLSHLQPMGPLAMLEVVKDLVGVVAGPDAKVTAMVGPTSDTKRLGWNAWVRAWVPTTSMPITRCEAGSPQHTVYRDAYGGSATTAVGLLVRELFTPGHVNHEEQRTVNGKARTSMRRVHMAPLIDYDGHRLPDAVRVVLEGA